MDASARARKLRLMAFDVDGVMTDGSIYYTDAGTELKAFNALDGAGLKMLEKAGITVAIITGRQAACVEQRARNLGIERLHQGVHDKVACLQTMLADLGLDATAAGYMGDDVMDLGAMSLCGFAVAPANAHDAVTSTMPEGRHALRGTACTSACQAVIFSANSLARSAFAVRGRLA